MINKSLLFVAKPKIRSHGAQAEWGGDPSRTKSLSENQHNNNEVGVRYKRA